MSTSWTDIRAEMIAGLNVAHANVDLSDADQVRGGLPFKPSLPGHRSQVGIAFGGLDFDDKAVALGRWPYRVGVDLRGFARSTQDTPEAREAAAVGLASDLIEAFHELHRTGTICRGLPEFRVTSVQTLDLHEFGGQAVGPWGWVVLRVEWIARTIEGL
jgi:hypothetical protein